MRFYHNKNYFYRFIVQLSYDIDTELKIVE